MTKQRVTKIEINLDSDKKEVHIKNDIGLDVVLDNVVIVGGNSADKSLYMFAEGSSENIGESLAGCFKWSRSDKEGPKVFFRRIFAFFIKWVAEHLEIPVHLPSDYEPGKFIGEIDAEAILARWDEEDRIRKKKEEDKTTWN